MLATIGELSPRQWTRMPDDVGKDGIITRSMLAATWATHTGPVGVDGRAVGSVGGGHLQ
jgi:hypothetical protein